MHFIQQASAQCPGWVGAGKIFFIKSARLHDRHRQRVTHHEGIDGAGGRFAGHRQQRDRFIFQTRNNQIQFLRATGVRDKQHHIAAFNHPQIAVQCFCRMDKKSRCAGTGKCCGDFLTNVARFANSRNHHFAFAVQDDIGGANKIIAQTFR